MDSSEFSGSLEPLSLPDKPLIGDLPADMEFGEDLLGSQTASTQEVSVLQPPDWDPSKQMTVDADLDLLVKADSLPELNKSNDLVLDKPSVLDMLEKPDVLDELDKTADLMELDKSEGLDGLYKAHPSQDVEDGPVDSALSREALVPETWKEGEDAPKNDSGDLKEDGAAAIPALSDDNAPELPPQAIPDSGSLSSAPATEEITAQSSSPPMAPPQLTLKQTKKTRLKAPRKSSPTQREGLAGEAEVELSPDNNSAALPPEPTEENQAEEGDDSGKNSLKESSVLKAQEASPPAGEGLPGKGSELPAEKEQKRSERARRSEAARPETVNSSESIPVSDEDSDAMVDDPNDEDFVPFRTRRSTRMSLRTQMAQRAARSTVTKMTCANCRTPLQKGQTAYQRKGLPQLFCSSSCLTTFSKKPPGKKICTFCKKEIWNTKDSVVAQIGSGASFHEFCTSVCLSLYEAQQHRPAPQSADASDTSHCSVCHKPGEIQHEVSNGNVVHRICSDACFTKFRATKGLKTNCCDNCGLYIYNKGLPLEYLFHEGQQKRFCNSACLNSYKKKNTRVYPCMWCKTLCKNFDMLPNVDRSGKMGLFCSICCTTSHKVKQSGLIGPPRPCSFCRKSLSEPCYYNKTDRVVYQFCSPSCWTKFQRTSPEGGIHLNCHYCHNLFSGKPEILDWQDKVYQFCCKDCCEDFKRLRGVVSQCEHCKQEKLLHEKIRFSGVEKNFCSEGCVLLYKQDFTKNLGLCCITCTYCSQTCQRAVTEQLEGSTWDFCSEDCKSKYLLWYFKAARCHACKRQGKLLETIHWRGQIKHFCNQQCLLRFYNQQNQPNLDTQKGPESLLNSQTSEPKPPAPSSQKAETNMLSAKTSSAQMSPAAPPPPPPPVPATPRKNKAAMCKPLMQNRGVSCKLEMKSKGCQTEADWKPQVIVLPIPVPIFVPVPMHMYCQKVPVPFSMPVPVPVPMFLPTTLESTDKIVETIEELKVKIPSNPLEADILAMAEMIAEAEELDKASSDLCDLVSNQSAEGLLEDCDLFGPARDDVLAMAVKMANVLDEPGQDLEADFPKNPLDINPSVDFLFDCGLVAPDEVSTEQDLPRAVRKGQKRLVLSESCSRDSVSSQPTCTVLNYSYGVNAWKSWVQAKYAGGETSKGEELRFGPKPMRIKEDILACTAAELNYGLAQFVKEITRPNGERYEPDSIYYLCLGIQQYLLENNRMVNIFTDLYYLTFVQELNKSLSGWQPTILPNNTVFSRVEEEHLWECKQLGVYSPFVLLNTLMFFNTKFFGLQTAEEHMQLSFTNVVRQSRKCTTARGMTKVVSIRYYAPAKQKKGRDGGSGKRKREEEVPMLEQRENRMNPLRCPVKFYEFYLSKCPESLRNRNDVFYLQPERSCIAESPLWYSVIPMDRSMLESMLNRILAVREIYEEHSRFSGLEDDMD
ncbi:zinc finger MYM-type protein 3 isoform X1 [Falco biarmicus]|uniref:zinc finger MYM-type protein 3 isoform X1 n=1 Tax=Falco rusticolus TaxID=120794 RepID=UPI001886898C|nr:zinc finger MYM-type protein 3 isoform X1 [Falco rusticolus]XP_037264258.1 zinc finger MYM-type protein 3 isoform X1 [Falco rusticolus]XP_037264259.1 zinc finger MYM-type protein 3 isoform X1 [Falco rusticolus]XP_037264260.1 zinc finger MYM-type protein 3 isoform X1 [Falco rusticolus]XP_037264261.1 zinc finger MYM-type protein 3 isoform X1 [Falco rusticolus]XP_037264262.1 zinc finger MYM-type protein 3 isoform X1 [Falco rusticolus]XP_055583045.1 zinc finger MYM-type protein 3 isoform X1 [F